jgi:hypothetical protein
MVDKITTLRRTRLGKRIGMLTDGQMADLRRAFLVFLGFAGDLPLEPQDATSEEQCWQRPVHRFGQTNSIFHSGGRTVIVPTVLQ